uniref:TBC1 domain family member 7 n=1 Tax=Plectus sambesii TaxID=2011161 RepID=A0A914XFT6_9BILA
MRSANFRSNYLAKVGGLQSSAETSKLLEEQLLAGESVIVDRQKLAQFALKYEIPSKYRVPVWKLLLGITPCYAQAKSLVAQHRQEQADLLYRSLQTMRKAEGTAEQPTAVDVVRMIQLESDRLPLGQDVWALGDSVRQTIASQMLHICGDSWAEAYWLTKLLDRSLSDILNTETVDSLLAEAKLDLAAVNQSLWAALGNGEVWDQLPLAFWLKSACAALFETQPLARLWDKICTGDRPGVLFTLKTALVEFLLVVGPQFIDQGAQLKLAGPIYHLSPEAQAKIVSRTLEKLASRPGRRSDTKR